MGFLDDVPLPEGDALLNTSAVLTLGMGAACVVAPRKIHEMYFADDDMDDDRVPVSAYKYYKKEPIRSSRRRRSWGGDGKPVLSDAQRREHQRSECNLHLSFSLPRRFIMQIRAFVNVNDVGEKPSPRVAWASCRKRAVCTISQYRGFFCWGFVSSLS